MPHVIVKLWPGKSERQKQRLADAIARDVMEILHYGEESVSVAMEEIGATEWVAKAFGPTFNPSPIKSTRSPATASPTCKLRRQV